jgi:response regulator of citrate/malate metabolism
LQQQQLDQLKDLLKAQQEMRDLLRGMDRVTRRAGGGLGVV